MIISKNLKVLSLFICISLMSGCVPGKGWMSVVKAPPDLLSVRKVAVVVENSCEATPSEEGAVQDAIIQKLNATGRFNHIETTSKISEGVPENVLVIESKIIGIKRVNRMMSGAFGGRGWIQLLVRLIDKNSGQVLGEALIEGFSSAGNAYAGNEKDAIREAAAKVVEFVVGGG